jgi:hypothetical protein
MRANILGLSLPRAGFRRGYPWLAALLGLSPLVLAGCDRARTIAVVNVTTTNSFCLVPPGTSVSGLSLEFQGHIDGTAYVYAANWPTQALHGIVNWQIYHDWLERDCVLQYDPVGVRTGRLSIAYQFR